jgi:Flp pilus assembly protein TadD
VSCAERHLGLALRLDPRGARTRLAAGRLALVRRAYTEAAIHLTEAVRAAPAQADPYNDLAVALEGLGRLDEARAHLETAARLAPGRADVHHNLGLVLSRLGRTEESEHHRRRAAELASVVPE